MYAFATSIWNVEWSEAGGPRSPFIFVTAADILEIATRNQENFKGIPIAVKKLILLQFAVDTTLGRRRRGSVTIPTCG